MTKDETQKYAESFDLFLKQKADVLTDEERSKLTYFESIRPFNDRSLRAIEDLAYDLKSGKLTKTTYSY